MLQTASDIFLYLRQKCGGVVEWLTHQTSNLWIATRTGSNPNRAARVQTQTGAGQSRCFIVQDTVH